MRFIKFLGFKMHPPTKMLQNSKFNGVLEADSGKKLNAVKRNSF